MAKLSAKQKEYREVKNNPPQINLKEIINRKHVCTSSTSTMTEGKPYTVIGYKHKMVRRNCGNGEYFWDWEQYVTIINDSGAEVTTRMSRFKSLYLA